MDGASAAELAQHAQMRRQPVVLDPDADSVLRVIDALSSVTAGAPDASATTPTSKTFPSPS